MLIQLLDSRMALLDLRPVNERLLHHAPKGSGPHGGLCLIQHPQKRAPLQLFPQGLCQFQISPAGAVDDHVFADGIGLKVGHMGQGLLLGLIKVFQQSARCDHTAA